MSNSVRNNSFYRPHYHPEKKTLYLFYNFHYCIKKFCKFTGQTDNALTLLPKELYKLFPFPSENELQRILSISGAKYLKCDETYNSLNGPFAICINHFTKEIKNHLLEFHEFPDFSKYKKIFHARRDEPPEIRQSCFSKENQKILSDLQNNSNLNVPNVGSNNKSFLNERSKKKSCSKKNEMSHFEDLISMAPDSASAGSSRQETILLPETEMTATAETTDIRDFIRISSDGVNFHVVNTSETTVDPSTSQQNSTSESAATSNFSLEELFNDICEQHTSSSQETSSDNFSPRHRSTSCSQISSVQDDSVVSDQLPKFQKFLQEVALPKHCIYEIDKNLSEFNYFGKLEVILFHPEKWSELELLQTVQKLSLKISHGTVNWCEEYEASEKYILSGAFGEMRTTTNTQNFVLTKKPCSLSLLLELELIFKTSSFQSTTNSLAGYLFLPTIVYCDQISIVHAYKLEEISSTVAILQESKLLTAANVNFLIREICKGLDHLHAKQIIHRDICATNIFVYNNQIQIGNFTYAVIETFSNNCISHFNQKMPMCSPEQIGIKENKLTQPLTTKIDIWAVACLYAELLTNCKNAPFSFPYKFESFEDFKGLVFSNPEIQLSTNKTFCFNPIVFDFLKRCLSFEPTNRPTASQLKQHQAVKHFAKLF